MPRLAVATIGLLLLLASGGADAAVAAPPLRDCASRTEGGAPPERRSRPGDVVVGPFAFSDLRRVASRAGLEHDRSRAGYGVKSGARVLAGTRATLVISRRARSWASLTYAARSVRFVSDGDPAVRFRACARSEPAFSYDGPVGIVTGFAGGFMVTRPGCVPVEVRIAGRRPIRARIPFGVGRCA